jgi:hypothetical protein
MSKSLLADWTDAQYRALEREIVLAPHQMHRSQLFSDSALVRLLDAHPLADLGINTMGTSHTRFEWREGDRNGVPSEALLELVRRGRLWINLRNVMRHHAELREAIDATYDELERRSPCFRAQQRSANLLISSPGALVHYHLDTPVNMLWHIRGRKRVWVYPLDERFVSQQYLEGVFSGELAEDLPYDESFDAFATVFDVEPGQMLTWPQNSPHRVTNLEGLNVSLSTEHKNARALRQGNVHLANQFLRRTCGLPCRSWKIDGPAAHAKQFIIRAARRLPGVRTEPVKKGNEYPVSFQVDPEAPLGYTLLDEAPEEAAEALGV